jgi:hypothetical protein
MHGVAYYGVCWGVVCGSILPAVVDSTTVFSPYCGMLGPSEGSNLMHLVRCPPSPCFRWNIFSQCPQELSVPGGPLQHAGHTAVEGDVDAPGSHASTSPAKGPASSMPAVAEGGEEGEGEAEGAGGAGRGAGAPSSTVDGQAREDEEAAAAAAMAAMITPAPPKRPADGTGLLCTPMLRRLHCAAVHG